MRIDEINTMADAQIRANEILLEKSAEKALNSFGEEEGVWELGLQQELNKLPYTKHLDDGQYNDGQIGGFELGATWCYNKLKENYKVESSLRELHQYKLGLEDGYNKAKEMEKERTLKLCYGVWRAAKSGANYIYITKDSDLLGYVEPLSEEDRLKIEVELFIAIKPI